MQTSTTPFIKRRVPYIGPCFVPSTGESERGTSGVLGGSYAARNQVNIEPEEYQAAAAPQQMRKEAYRFQDYFGIPIPFETLVYFAPSVLSNLHVVARDATDINGEVVIASREKDRATSILAQMATLTEIATRVAKSSDRSVSDKDSKRYSQALENIYRNLPEQPTDWMDPSDTLCIGIEREGRILAEKLQWLSTQHSEAFHAKRIVLDDGGLLVGLTRLPSTWGYSRCVIVDGAIASGATIISVLKTLPPAIQEVRIYSVHSSFEGLRAIVRYAQQQNRKVKIIVGHATAGISSKFYSIDTNQLDDRGEPKLVVGDLGDTITRKPPIDHG